MSIFGFYFVSDLLREAGWPKKQGILRKNVVDTKVLDGAIDQMINWAASIGAGRPQLGLRVLAEMFRNRDWDSDNAPSIRDFINEMRSQNSAWAGSKAMAPKEVVSPSRFARLGKTIDAGKLTDEQMRTALEQFCLEGLLWGIANPEAFGSWYAAYVEDSDRKRSLARAHGLDIEEPSNLSALFEDSEKILRNYEQDIGDLPKIPDRLLLEAKELGWKV